MDYAEGMAKAGIVLMNVDQQGTGKVTLCHWELPWGVSHRHQEQM